MTATDPTRDVLLGSSVGRYQLVRVIGQGGMGRVYEGIDPAIGSRVAIKVINEAFARDPELADRFFAEARAVNMIRHECIVNVLEHTTLPDGRPLIVMEYIEGRTLRDALEHGPLPLGGVSIVMIEVLGALSAAHAIGIVHRDLKPDNIVITPTGRPKVLDFGIAKLLNAPPGRAAPRTKTGVVLGTPEYMAPEYISDGIIDVRSDVYAMGVVMFEAVTGRRPFEGPTDFEIMRQHVEEPPPRPRTLRPDLPELVEHVLLAALAKHPRDRFASANAMAIALHTASAALPADAWRSLGSAGALVLRPSAPTLQPLAAASVDTVRIADVAGEAAAAAAAGRLDVRTAKAAPAVRPSGDNLATVRDSVDKLGDPPPRRRRAVIALGVAGIAVAGAVAFALGRRTAPGASSPAPIAVAVVPADAGAVALVTPDAAAVAIADPSPPAPVATSKSKSKSTGTSTSTSTSMPLTQTIPLAVPSPAKTFTATYDPRHFDTNAFYPTALAQARSILSDAELSVFSVKGVTSDGRIDLTASRTSSVSAMLIFRSPSAAVAKPPSGPSNLPFKRVCNVVAMPGVASYQIVAAPSELCTPTSLTAPRCTLAQVMAKAKDQGVAADLAATLTLMPRPKGLKTQQWQVDVGDHNSFVVPDDCGLASASDNPADPTPSLPGMVLIPVAPDAPYDLRESGRFSIPLPKRVTELDAVAYVPTATMLARKLEPDATFERLELHPVDSKGHVVIGEPVRETFPHVIYFFASAARAKAKPGPDDVLMCEIKVELDTNQGTKAYVQRVGDKTCPARVPKPPKCTIAQIWAKGLANGAPADALASITYYDNGEWWFDDVRNYGAWKRMIFADDCP